MAFDAAASAVQAPPPGANASAKSAVGQSDASDPFGALLAMLDGAQSKAAPAAPPRPATEAAAAKAGETDTPAATDAGKDAPAAEAEAPLDAAVSDPAILMAAMMVPAAVTPAPVVVAAIAEAAAPAPAAPTAAEVVVPPLDLGPSVAEAVPAAVADETGPALGVTPPDPTAQTAEAKPAVPATQAPQPQAVPPTQAALPTDAAAPTPTAPAEPASRLAANDKPADPARADAAATETDFAVAPRASAQGEHLGGDADGQQSDADATQQARTDAPAAPTPDASFAAAASAGPESSAPAVGAAQPAAAAPVIAAQAATTPVRGMPETVAHLAAQMVQRLNGQTTRFDLTLNPQSLGRVDVRIEIGAKGALRARMAFDDAATAQEMSGRHTELRAALQSAGFDVPEGALSFDVASGGGGAHPERQDGDRAAAPIFQNLANTADQDAAVAVKNYFSAAGSSGVDIRV